MAWRKRRQAEQDALEARLAEQRRRAEHWRKMERADLERSYSRWPACECGRDSCRVCSLSDQDRLQLEGEGPPEDWWYWTRDENGQPDLDEGGGHHG